MIRRPSPALVVALLALFVALGGPAEAKKLLIKTGAVGSKQIKDRSVTAKDLADGSVTAGKVAKDAVGGNAVRNGSLGGLDIGGFAGVAKITMAALPSGCTGGTSAALTPLVAGQDLGDDAIVVTPPANFPGGASVTARPEGKDKITVTACGPAAPGGDFTFRYVAIVVA